MDADCDVLIAGGGPVGAALALALRETPLRVTRVDAGAAGGERPRGDRPRSVRPRSVRPRSVRPIALSHGSRLIIEGLGAFESLLHTPIRHIHVSQQGALGRSAMSAREQNVPALGYVVSYENLLAQFNTWLASAPLAGRVGAWSHENDGVRVEIEAGGQQFIRAKLLVLADGGHASTLSNATSATRNSAPGSRQLGMRERDYAQEAIVAHVRMAAGHAREKTRHTAFERFTPEGPLALLPDGDGYALVWCARVEKARELLSLGEPEFLARLQTEFGYRAGIFSDCGPRETFPLALRVAHDARETRVIAIGNAAQSLHPVAGQGLNLGFRDVWELATAIINRPACLDDAEFARQFKRDRRLDRRAGIGFTDLMVRAYSNDHPLLRLGRGAALGVLDLFPPARRALAHAMMFGIRKH